MGRDGIMDMSWPGTRRAGSEMGKICGRTVDLLTFGAFLVFVIPELACLVVLLAYMTQSDEGTSGAFVDQQASSRHFVPIS